MTCRIREDAPAPLPVPRIEQRSAQIDDVFLSSVQVRDTQVEVELLGSSGIRPVRWLMVFHSLECQHESTVGVERRPAVAKRPPWIRLIHPTAEKRLVEPGQPNDIDTVQHHTLQLGDHERQRLTAGRLCGRTVILLAT